MRIPSIVDCPVPYRLSKRCFISASFTTIAGNRSLPDFSSARRRVTPVVVSSVEPRILASLPPRSVHERDEVGPVVHDHVRVRVQERPDARVVLGDRLSLLGPREDSVFADGGYGVIVGGERISRGETNVGPCGFEREGEHAGLCFHVEDRGHCEAPQRLLRFEPPSDSLENRHVGSRPFDFETPPSEVPGHGKPVRG